MLAAGRGRMIKLSPGKILGRHVHQTGLHRQDEVPSRNRLCFSLIIRTEHMGDAIRLWQHHDQWDRIWNLVPKVQYCTRKRSKFLSRTNSVVNLCLNYFGIKTKISPRCCSNEENGLTVTSPTVTEMVLGGGINDVVKFCATNSLTSPTKHNITVKIDFIVLQSGPSTRPWRRFFRKCKKTRLIEEKAERGLKAIRKTRERWLLSAEAHRATPLYSGITASVVGTNENYLMIIDFFFGVASIQPEQLTFLFMYSACTITRSTYIYSICTGYDDMGRYQCTVQVLFRTHI